MVRPLHLYLALVAAFAAERLVELAVSRRHAAALRTRGGVEVGQGHYRPMVLLHGAFLAACAAEAVLRREPPGAWALLFAAGAVAAQALRWWAVATLGERWTTRVVVLPGAPLVTGGPYRWLAHPNYLAVVVELACLPLAYGGWWTAAAFSAANAALLRVRIRTEEAALGLAWRRTHDAA